MPKAPRRCPARGCTELIKHTKYCPDHTPSWTEASGWRKPAGWDRDRQTVLERDDYTCHVCGGSGADTVDHVIPQSQGGADRLANYAAIHDRTPPHCHRAKTNQDKTTQ
jgi:5-methylcytosine-specific restriction protein A